MNPDFPPGAPAEVTQRWEETGAVWRRPERVVRLVELALPGPADSPLPQLGAASAQGRPLPLGR